jgi:hypothetical protein
MKKYLWYWAAICALSLLWLQAEWRSWQSRAAIELAYMGDVAIEVIDAESKQPLNISLHPPSVTINQRWPKYTLRTNSASEMSFRWVDAQPVEIGVSSEGYAEQRLKLDQGSEHRIVVALRR